jgi:hypothetical protein
MVIPTAILWDQFHVSPLAAGMASFRSRLCQFFLADVGDGHGLYFAIYLLTNQKWKTCALPGSIPRLAELFR